MNFFMIFAWEFDWPSALIGLVVGLGLCLALMGVYLALRPEPPVGGYAAFEDEEPLVDDELSSAQERGTQAVVTAAGVPPMILGPPAELEPVRFGRVGDPHVYRRAEWDRAMACVGPTCNQAPFVDGQRFYEIPVAGDDTALLVCVDCAADPE